MRRLRIELGLRETSLKKILHFVFSLGAYSFVFLFGYSLVSRLWVEYGHTSSRLFLVECPLVFFFALLFFFPSRNGQGAKARSLLASFVPLLCLYVLFDLFYLHLDRTPKVSDLKSIPDLFRVSPMMVYSLAGMALAAMCPAALSFWHWFRQSAAKDVALVLAAKAVILILIMLAFDSTALYKFQKKNAGITAVRTEYDVKGFGRLASLQYFHARALVAQRRLAKHPEVAHYRVGDYFWKEALAEKRNVHIIVLESFIDVRRIRGADYGANSPLCPDLNKYLVRDGTFSQDLSPIYGGGTCQAEFELLTGLPALSLIESNEFLCLNGSLIDSFVNQLKQNGYRAVATIGASAKFFNSKNAYKSIGFDEVHFIDDDAYFSKAPGDTNIFDGDLLDANASMLDRRWLSENNGHPLVNYVLGFYGHCPIGKDSNKERPDAIHVSGEPAEVGYMANQFYYRTQAVARFLERLSKIDPESVILVISDHLPFPPASTIQYEGEKRDNIAVLLDRFKPVDVSGKHYYEIPHVLWKLLSDARDPLNINTVPPQVLENLNCVLMMEGMGLRPREARMSLDLAASPARHR